MAVSYVTSFGCDYLINETSGIAAGRIHISADGASFTQSSTHNNEFISLTLCFTHMETRAYDFTLLAPSVEIILHASAQGDVV